MPGIMIRERTFSIIPDSPDGAGGFAGTGDLLAGR